MTTLSDIPDRLVAGDLWAWTRTLADYPASAWTLTYYFRGPEAFSAAASPSGDDHAISIPATTTADYAAGQYRWLARVVNGSSIYTIESGLVVVDPNLAKTGIEYRGYWQRVRDALQAVIENRATTDQLSMTIGGRSLSRMSWDEILKAHDYAVVKAAAELGDNPSKIFVRFG